jgi:hypothetical protein
VKPRISVKIVGFMGPLLLCMALSACTNTKKDRCVTIRKVIKTEMTTTKEVAEKLRDPQALTAHAEFLKTTIAELQKVKIEDAALKQAVQTYINGVEKLAEGYKQAAEGLKLADKGDLKAAGDKMPGPASGLVIYGTIVDSTRIRIADECNKR